MEPERARVIERLYRQALEKEPGQRSSYLQEACGNDASLRYEVEYRLHQEEMEGFLETPALHEVARRLAEDLRDPDPDLVGRSLAHYFILEKVGEGGMGVVYRARDEHLQRDVAVKVLPSGTLNDELSRRRFRKEALALSKLNHPNIGTVHDFDTQQGIDFLVMEYVGGTNLRDRLLDGPLPGEEVLRAGEQLVEGLKAAHSQGVIHCDLKPGNLIINGDGRLKILDFGLAKLLKPTSETSTTESLSETPPAAGTLPYMAPEQLRGQSIDARSDIFAFGTVLYEMATGRRAFDGNTSAVICDAIFNKNPIAPSQLNPDVPGEIERIIRKAIEKDPRNRYQSAKELVADFRRVREAAEEKRSRRFGTAKTLVGALLAAAACFAVTLLWFRFRDQPLPEYFPRPVTRSTGWESEPEVSPDGNRVVYASDTSGNREIWLSDLNGNRTRLTDDEADDSSPTWFPDGKEVAFVSERGGSTGIWSVSSSGGRARPLVSNAKCPAVSPDGNYIAFSSTRRGGDSRIFVQSLNNPGGVRQLTDEKGGFWNHTDPAWSPDSREICYASRHGLWVVSVTGGPARRLTSDQELDFDPAWSHQGRHIYFSSYRGGVLAIWRVNLRGGQPERVTTGIGPESHPSLPWNGNRLVHATLTVNHECTLLDLKSGERTVVDASESDYIPSISGDGTRIVYASRRSRAGTLNLWSQTLNNGKPAGPPKQLTYFAESATFPALSPDDRWVAFYRIISGQRDIWIVPNSGGESIRFTDDAASDMYPAWSPDGTKLAFVSERAGVSDIWVAPVKDGKRSGRESPLTTGPVSAELPAWSPDGSTIAFTGSLGDRSEAWQVSGQGQSEAVRLTDGAEVVRICWDPVSRDLLASASWGTNRVNLWRIAPTGVHQLFSPPIEFGPKGAAVGLFDISRNGRFLVFGRSGGAKGQVWSLEVQNGVF
jgi:Tol biopolymer transport system component